MTDKIHPHRASVPPVTRIAKIEPQGRGVPRQPEPKPIVDSWMATGEKKKPAHPPLYKPSDFGR